MATMNFRVADNLKEEAFNVIKGYGLTPSQVFNLFLTEIANTKTIPLNLNYLRPDLRPNARTLEAIRESESGEAERMDISSETNKI